MINNFNRKISEQIDNNLILKTPKNEKDIERLAEFNGMIHEEVVARMTKELIYNHPKTDPCHWLMIEDTKQNKIVSSIALIPWQIQYGSVILKSAEMGIVGTDEAYRGKGLIGRLVDRFNLIMNEEEFDLTHIQGIPNYYRKFGYQYCIPLENNTNLELHLIPQHKSGDQDSDKTGHFSFRKAGIDDIHFLQKCYQQFNKNLQIRSIRDHAIWKYLLTDSMKTETAADTYLVADRDKKDVGYFRVNQHGFGDGLIVSEVSDLSYEAAVAVIRQLKEIAIEKKKPFIRLNMSRTSSFMQAAYTLGANDCHAYAWQIKLNIVQFLNTIKPILEERLQGTVFDGLTEAVNIGFFKYSVTIEFNNGKINSIEFNKDGSNWQFAIPLDVVAPLMLGYRSRNELTKEYPDMSIWGKWSLLCDLLFPKMDSYLYIGY